MSKFQLQPFKAFTDEQWQAYLAIRWPAAIDWDEAQRQMEEACREYSERETQREQHRRSVAYKATLDSAAAAAGRLRVALSNLEELSPSGNDLEGLPDLGVVEERLKHLHAQYEIYTSPYSGKRNRIRETFDSKLFSIFETQFHGKIRASKTRPATPTITLIRFLSLTYEIVLGKSAPGQSGVRKIVEDAQQRWRGSSRQGKRVSRKLRQRDGVEADLSVSIVPTWRKGNT